MKPQTNKSFRYQERQGDGNILFDHYYPSYEWFAVSAPMSDTALSSLFTSPGEWLPILSSGSLDYQARIVYE